MKPLISIIIPTFNRALLIAETLESVRLQSFINFECLVIDDFSEDHTEEVLRKITEKDARFIYIKKKLNNKKGASSSRNLGLRNSKGKFVVFLDSDDLLPPNKLEIQVEILKDFRPKFICCSGWILFQREITEGRYRELPFENNKQYSGCDFLNTLGSSNNFCPPHCYLIPKDVIDLAGGWDESLSNNDDAEFMTRVILASTGVIFSEEPRVYYRKFGKDHLSNFSNRRRVRSAVESINKIEQHLRKGDCEDLIYVYNAKRQMFNTLKNKFPVILVKYKDFFEKEFKEESFRLSPVFIFKKCCRNILIDLKQLLLNFQI